MYTYACVPTYVKIFICLCTHVYIYLGISADGELPEEMLLEIYERIAAAPISMTQDVGRRNKKEEVYIYIYIYIYI
jgi:hypothetical protein